MNAPAVTVDAHASGWHAALELGFEARPARTVLARRRHHGPLLVQRPFHPEPGGVCHAYLLHPPAGIAGGDTLELDVDVGPGAHALVTTPSATRFYRSDARTASIVQRLRVAAGGTLEWLPQETLLFEGAHARIDSRIELRAGARVCAWEMIGLGRPASGEGFASGAIDFRLAVERDGAPLLIERLRPTVGRALSPGGAALRGHAASATFIMAPADEVALAVARAALDDCTHAGATLIGDLLVCRVLGTRIAPVRARCEALWHALRPLALGRAAAFPRIWST